MPTGDPNDMPAAYQPRLFHQGGTSTADRADGHVWRHAAIGLAVVATDGRWLDANPAFCQLVGYNHEELLQRSLQELPAPNEPALDIDQITSVLSKGADHYTLEQHVQCQDGRLRWMQMTISLVSDAQEQPSPPLAVVLEDIDARKRAEAQRAAEQALMVSVAQSEQVEITIPLSGEHRRYRPWHLR
jgi:PAS domain S-box-containing protein